MTSAPLTTMPNVEQDPVLATYRRYWKLLVLLPLLAGIAGVGFSFLMKPIYTAAAQIIPPQQQSAGSALLGAVTGISSSQLGGLGSIAGLKNPADQWVGMLTSRSIADALVKRFDLQNIYGSEYHSLAREKLQGSTKISAGKDGLIDIEVDDTNPERAQQLANGYIEELTKLTNRLALTEAKQRRIFFEAQLDQIKNKLIAAETQLKQSTVSAALVKITPDTALADIAQLQSMVSLQEIKLASMRGTFNRDAPVMRQAEIELAALRHQLAQAEKPISSQNKSSTENYVGAYREFKYQEMLFELFAKQFEMAKTDEARESGSAQVIDAAEIPELKSRPKRLAVGAFTWLASQALMLLGFAILAHRRSTAPANKQ